MKLGNDVPNGQGGILVVKKPWPSMIRTIYGDPERFKKSYYPPELKGYYLAGDGAIRDAEDRLLHDHRPHRRRAQRLRPPHGHDGDRIGPGQLHRAGGRSGRGRPPRRHHRRGDLRLRRAEALAPDRRRSQEDRQPSCATGWPRRSARSPSPRTSASATTCPRHAAARSCAACCAASPRARRSRRTPSTLENPAILEQLSQAL